MAVLSLNDQEDAIEEACRCKVVGGKDSELCLVGCFLTVGLIHFPAMRSTMENLWHPVKGIQILDIGEKKFLFCFFHVMDMEHVFNGSPCTFNNHLLLLHRLSIMEHPLKVPILYVSFLV